MQHAVVVMGVSGCGKSSLGAALAAELGCDFVDADDLHPPANVAKMRGGTPLSDEDRWPWLEAVGEAMRRRLERGDGVVVACSALKRVYRDILRTAGPTVRFLHLDGPHDLIAVRLAGRGSHFFDPALLASQFATLERPNPAEEPDVTVLDAATPLDLLVDGALAALET